MDASTPTSDAPASAEGQSEKPRAKKRRRWPWVLLGALVVLAVLVALAPTLASLGPARRFALGKVNEQLDGKVEVESWSLGWFSGVRLDGLRVLDADGQPAIEADSIVVPASVPALAGSRKELGTIEINGPKVHVVFYPDGSLNLAKIARPSEEAPPEAEEPEPLGFDVFGTLRVKGGEIVVTMAEDPKPLAIRELDVEANIEGINKPIGLTLGALIGEERARLCAKGSATVMKEGLPDPEALRADLTVEMDPVDLAPVARLARQFNVPVHFAGKVGATLKAQLEGTRSVKASGDVAATEVSVSGGPLGDDTPSLARLSLGFDVGLAGGKITVGKLDLGSPLASIAAQGELAMPEPGTFPAGTLTTRTKVDLAAVHAQLPHTIQLPQGLTIDSGTLDLTTELVAKAGAPGVQTTVRLENLAAKRQDKRIRLAQPVVLTAVALLPDTGPRIDTFELTSSLLTAKGSASVDQLDVELASDLASAVAEVAQLVDLGGKTLRGKATLALKVTTPQAQQKKATVAIRLDDLEVGGIGPKPVAVKELTLDLGGLAQLTAENALDQLRDLSVEVASPVANAHLTAASLKPETGKPLPVTLEGGKLSVSTDLAEGLAVGRSLAELDPALGVKGRASFDCALSLADGIVRADTLDISVKGLDFQQGDKHLRQDEIRITARAEAEPESSAAKLRDLVCQLPFGKLEVPTLDAANWTTAPEGVVGELRAQVDVAKALAALKDFVELPKDTSIATQASLAAQIQGGKDEHKASLNVELNALKVVADGKPVADGEKVVLETVAALAAKYDAVTLSTLKLASPFAGLDATASARDLTSSRKLQAEGTLDLHFDRIGPLVAAFSDQEIEMAGSQSKGFKLDTSLAGKDWRDIVRETLASAGVEVEKVKIAGLNLTALKVPLDAGKGKAVVNVTSGFEGGKLAVPATLDVSGEIPVLTLPDDTVVLADVALSDAVAQRLLGPVSPLFKGAPVAAGEIGVIARKFRLELGDKPLETATIELDLKLHAVGLRKIPFLQPILDVAKLTPEKFALPDQKIGFALKEGRIHHSPISIGVGELRLAVGGSIGLDKTLDMYVELPITPGMLGGKTELFGLLKNERLRIPVVGRALNPVAIAGYMKDAIADLVKAAAKKALTVGTEGVTKGVGSVTKGVGSLIKGKDDKDKDKPQAPDGKPKDDGNTPKSPNGDKGTPSP